MRISDWSSDVCSSDLENGFEVKVVATHDLPLIKQRHDVPEALGGCHTILIGGYVVEGHVPASTLNKLLTERPAIKGISLPGMPTGSPGMGGPKAEPLTTYAFGGEAPSILAVEGLSRAGDSPKMMD